MRQKAMTGRGVRAALFTVLALGALLLSIVAMHAPMVQHSADPDAPIAAGGAVAPIAGMPMAAMAAQAVVGSELAMDSMNPADCLLLGMVCLLSAVSMVLLVLLRRHPQAVRRSRDLSRSVRGPLGSRRASEPPSLVVLSISRT